MKQFYHHGSTHHTAVLRSVFVSDYVGYNDALIMTLYAD